MWLSEFDWPYVNGAITVRYFVIFAIKISLGLLLDVRSFVA